MKDVASTNIQLQYHAITKQPSLMQAIRYLRFHKVPVIALIWTVVLHYLTEP